LPLIGVAAVVAGASLSWHRLYGAGDRFGVSGWHEPLAVLIVAVALSAGVAALLTGEAALRGTPPTRRATAPADGATHASAATQTAARSRLRIGPRFATVFLGLVTLAGTLLAIVYLPLKARFDTQPLAFMPSHGLGAVFDHFVMPLPGPGLLLAIVGAALIVVGGLTLHAAPRPAVADPDAEAPRPLA
jgi:hypothetical protein